MFGKSSSSQTATPAPFGGFSSSNAPPANAGSFSNAFGKPASQASTVFGQASIAPTSNPFGAPSSAAVPAGFPPASNAPANATSSPNAFGKPSSSQAAFKGFGQADTASNPNPFGSPQPAAQASSTTGGFRFGQATKGAFSFGSSAQAAASSSSASPPSVNSAFTNPKPNVFDATATKMNTANAFGASPTATSPAAGFPKATTGVFGNMQQSNFASPVTAFGQPPTTPPTNGFLSAGATKNSKLKTAITAPPIRTIESIEAEERNAVKALYTEMESEMSLLELYKCVLVGGHMMSAADCEMLRISWNAQMKQSQLDIAKLVSQFPKWATDKTLTCRYANTYFNFAKANKVAYLLRCKRSDVALGDDIETLTGEGLYEQIVTDMAATERKREVCTSLLTSLSGAVWNLNPNRAPHPTVIDGVNQLVNFPDPENSRPIPTADGRLPSSVRMAKSLAEWNPDVFEAFLMDANEKDNSDSPPLTLRALRAWGSVFSK